MISPTHFLPPQGVLRGGDPLRDLPPQRVLRGGDPTAPRVEGEVLVKLKPEQQDRVEQFLDHYGAQIEETIHFPPAVRAKMQGDLLRLKLPEGLSTDEALARMNEDPRCSYAASNDILQTLRGPQTPLSNKLWGLRNVGQNHGKAGADIKAEQAWAISHGNRQGPVVAVVDSGVDYHHPNLSSNIWTNPEDGSHGFNAIQGSHDPMDEDGHGTHCTGTIAAQGLEGVYGVNWEAQVMPIRFLDAHGSGKTSDAIKGLAFAAEHGARITSNSWGGSRYNPALRDVLASTPCLHICASGNEGQDNDVLPSYPSNYDLPNLLSVTASDRWDNLGSFSNRGAQNVDLAAPGVDIWSTVPGGGYEAMDGTSMAAPHVAGAATLIAAAYPGISNEQIKARLLYNVDRLPAFEGKTLSGGRLNLGAAMKADPVAPGRIDELKTTHSAPGKLGLEWVASGDDGTQGGKAAAYQVRYSNRRIVEGPPGPGEISFEEASVATLSGSPAEPGTRQCGELDLPLFEQDQSLHVAMRAVDHVGNLSPITILQTTVPASRLAFEDRKDPSQWVSQGDWGQQEVEGRGLVWTDSPNTDYSNSSDTSLTSQPFSLRGLQNPRLLLDSSYVLEQNYDNCRVEVSQDGKTWKTLDSMTGNGGWKTHNYDLSGFDGDLVRLRFHLTTDNSGPRDGCYFDRIRVAGN